MKVNQLKDGTQERRYADHIYMWELVANNNETEEDVLNHAFGLKKAGREKEKFLMDTLNERDFDKSMEIECGGYYEFNNVGIDQDGNTVYRYSVVMPYID